MAEAAREIKSTSGNKDWSQWIEANREQLVPWATLVSLLLVLIYVYWNSFDYNSHGAMWYWDNPKYSHGWLVPLFTMILLWMRHEPFGEVTPAARWTGLGLLTGALVMRLVFTYYPSRVMEMDSFVPAVLGVFLMVGGWKTLRWAGPPILFLIFMFPLPGALDGGLLAPLQRLATKCSTYALQTLGIAAYHEGNRIELGGEVQLGVVEACSGLRMLTIFMALSVAITLVTERPLWERAVIIASAIPIALAVNITRITMTGVVYMFFPGLAHEDVHDLAGWFMMPIALGLLYVEFQILSNLVLEEETTGPLKIG